MLALDPSDNTIHFFDDKTGQDRGSFCEGFFVEQVYSDLFTGEETAVIKVYSKAGINRTEISMGDFTPSSLPKHLLAHGVTFLVVPNMCDEITAYALDSKNVAPIKRIFNRLGWYNDSDKRYYLASNLLSPDKDSDNYCFMDFEKLNPKGTFEAWRDGLVPFLQRPEIVLALTIGASAVMVPILKEAGVFNASMIFALIGKSTTFKTTALKLMASIYGKPEIGSGVIDTMLDTTNYFYHLLGAKNGFAHFIDDVSAAYGHDFTNEVYNISMGKGRGRLNPDGTPRKVDTWSTTVVYTGESSILAQTNGNLGLYARLIELSFEWLSNNDDVNVFYDVINNNYGVAIEPLVKLLFRISTEDIKTIYQKMQEKLVLEIKPSKGIGERIVNTFAVLLTTLVMCNKAWDLDLKIDTILPLLEETYAKNNAVEDPASVVIDSLKAQILIHNSKFPSSEASKMFSQDAWGIRGTYKDSPCIWIVFDKMKELAIKAGIPSIKDIQKELADRGFLVRDHSNHYIFQKSVQDGIKTACYGIFLNSESQNPKPSEKKSKKSVIRKDITKPNLLADEEETGIPP